MNFLIAFVITILLSFSLMVLKSYLASRAEKKIKRAFLIEGVDIENDREVILWIKRRCDPDRFANRFANFVWWVVRVTTIITSLIFWGITLYVLYSACFGEMDFIKTMNDPAWYFLPAYSLFETIICYLVNITCKFLTNRYMGEPRELEKLLHSHEADYRLKHNLFESDSND